MDKMAYLQQIASENKHNHKSSGSHFDIREFLTPKNIIIAIIALRTKKYDFGTICGILCGAMANPMALVYANDTTKGETSNISYATVYPLGMFIRVIIAQVLVMFFV